MPDPVDRGLTSRQRNFDGQTRIGFVGIGLMGHGIAKNLVTKGIRSRCACIATASPPRTSSQPARARPLVRELAARADIVVLCVTGAPQVEEVVFGPMASRAARARADHHRHVDERAATTTRTREMLAREGRALRRRAARAHAGGGRAGRSTSWSAPTTRRSRAEARAVGVLREHHPRGPPGHGHLLKLINNFIAQAICTATPRRARAAAKSGLSIRKLHEVISAGAVNSGLFQMLVGSMLDGGDLTGSSSRSSTRQGPALLHALHRVDDAARRSSAKRCTRASSRRTRSGFGDKYVPSLIEAQEKLAGVRSSARAVTASRARDAYRRISPCAARGGRRAHPAALPRADRVDDKGGARGYDPVTEADRAAEAVIRAAIARRIPDHGIHGEEHGAQPGRRRTRG
jgi:3-hydroxyisobutyrate dehydrogenase-like beta-hydroxyacid dehydrogenase